MVGMSDANRSDAMKTLTQLVIEKLTADAEYYWAENAAFVRQYGRDNAVYLAAYNRRMFAVKYLKSR